MTFQISRQVSSIN